MLVLILVSCNSLKDVRQNIVFFEGELHYDLEFESYTEEVSIESLKSSFGTNMIELLRDDAYLINYSFPETESNLKMLIDLENRIGLTELTQYDTLLQFDIEMNEDELVYAEIDTSNYKVINGEKCNSIKIRYIPKSNHYDLDYIEAIYYYSPKYKVNLEFYTTPKFSFLNIFYELSEGAIALSDEVTYYPKFKITHRLNKILNRQVGDFELQLSQSKQTKKISTY